MPHSISQGWSLSPADKVKYNSLFQQNVLSQQDFLSSQRAREIFMQSKLNPTELFSIWNLVDPGQTGRLNVEQFSAAMHLIFGRLSGKSLPSSLPSELHSLISGGSTSNTFQNNPSNTHQNNQFITPTSGRSLDSGSSAFPVSFPDSQSQNSYSNQNREFDFTKLKALETEFEKKRALVANIPPPPPPISDQEIHDLKSNIQKIYHTVPFHHPNFFTFIFQKSDTPGNSRNSDLAGSLKSEIDKLFNESFDSTLTDLADKIFQCQSELFKLEDAEQYGYTLPTNVSAPVIPQISSSGDSIAQKAAAMLAQRMQQLNMTAPAQTIPADAQNRIQEKDALLKKDYEDRKSRANQLIITLEKFRKDFDDLVASSTKSNLLPSELKQKALDWQSGSQCSSYKVGRFVEELSAIGKSSTFPPEVKTSMPREHTPLHSRSSSAIKTSFKNINEDLTPVNSTNKTKDLIEKFRNVESSNDPFSTLVSEKEKQYPERDLFSQIIQNKEKQGPERDLFSQIIRDKETIKGQPKGFFEDSTIPDFSKPQSDLFAIKNKFEEELEPVNSNSSSIPPPPPLPNLSATVSSGAPASTLKSQGLDSKESVENKSTISSISKNSPDDTIHSTRSKRFFEEISSSKEESTSRSGFSDNPFARLNKTPEQSIQATEVKKSISENNPFSKAVVDSEPSLPPGVKFSVSAIYAYEESKASITFQPGDILYITDGGDDPEGEWYFGYVKNQPEVEDWFPRSFVALLGKASLPRSTLPEQETQPEPIPYDPEVPPEPEGVTVDNEPDTDSSSWRIIYEFAPEDSDNPSPIPVDTVVVLLDQSDPDWWLIEDPRSDSPPDSQVYVPANFLEVVA